MPWAPPPPHRALAVSWPGEFMIRIDLEGGGFAAGVGTPVFEQGPEGEDIFVGTNWESGAFASATGSSISLSGGTFSETLGEGVSRTSNGGFEPVAGPPPASPPPISITAQVREPSGNIITSMPGGPNSNFDNEIAKFMGRIGPTKYDFTIGRLKETGGEFGDTSVTSSAGLNINPIAVRPIPPPGETPSNILTFTINLPEVEASDASLQIFWNTAIRVEVRLIKLNQSGPPNNPVFSTEMLGNRVLQLNKNPDDPGVIGGTLTFAVDIAAKEITSFTHIG
jgi:hypothetical protein